VTFTQSGDEYIDLGFGIPGYSASAQYASSMSGYSEGGSINVDLLFISFGASNGACAIGLTTNFVPSANYIWGFSIDTVLNDPTVSWIFAQVGLDYRPVPQLETVVPRISIEQGRGIYW